MVKRRKHNQNDRKRLIDMIDMEKIQDDAYNIASNYNEKELEILIKELAWWLKERERQVKEIENERH